MYRAYKELVMKLKMFIGLVVFFVLLLQVQGCSKTPTPANNENNTTNNVTSVALFPLYIIFGAVEVVKTVAIGAITVPVMAVKAITSSNDVNNTK